VRGCLIHTSQQITGFAQILASGQLPVPSPSFQRGEGGYSSDEVVQTLRPLAQINQMCPSDLRPESERSVLLCGVR
jgi:hypothetical protein